MPQAADELHDLDDSVFGSHLASFPVAWAPKAAEECFGIEIIVTLFHQLGSKHFLHGGIPAGHPFHSAHCRGAISGKAVRLGSRDSFPTKTLEESVHKESGESHRCLHRPF